MKKLEVFVACVPPTRTAQQKGVRVSGGKPLFFTKPEVREVNRTLWALFYSHRPKQPFDGPIAVNLSWHFPLRKCDTEANYHSTRPDLNNLAKGLEDVLTSLGFWHDDSQICQINYTKLRSPNPGIYLKIRALA